MGWVIGVSAAAEYMCVSHKPEFVRELVMLGKLDGYVPYKGARPRFSTEDMDAIVRSWPKYKCAL